MDIEKILASLHKLANTKIITLLLILGVAAYFVHENLDFITEVTFKVDHSGSQHQEIPKKDNANLYANFTVDTKLIPVQFDIPSYLLITVTNSGPANAYNLEALVDTGKSKITALDIKPKDRCDISSGNKDNVGPIRVVCKTVNNGESIYIYSLLSEATFRSILVTSPNLYQPVLVNYHDHPTEGHTGPTFTDVVTFLIEAIAVIAIVFIGIFLLKALVDFLERVFKT